VLNGIIAILLLAGMGCFVAVVYIVTEYLKSQSRIVIVHKKMLKPKYDIRKILPLPYLPLDKVA